MNASRFISFLLLFFVTAAVGYAQPVPLTFRVDMSQETLSPNGVHVAGNFQAAAGYSGDWMPGATMLSDPNGDSVYELTVEVPPGTYQYKFINGSGWGEKPELPPADCALNDGGGNFNRQVVVGEAGLNLPALTFDSCNATLRLAVNMEMETVAPEGVFVMGNFQEVAGLPANWDPTAVPLEDEDGDGVFETRFAVPPGDYQYVFINGVTAETPPSDCAVEGPDGQPVRTVAAEVGTSGPLVYCFGSCTLCDPAFSLNFETHWWNDAVFYEIFVRSFYDSDGDGIGDFQGIVDKMDYLNDGDPETDTDLGITGIWLMPMMESPSYHGYDATDYYATEPDYGTMEDFEALLEAAHDRGIKVIIDFVMNHTSDQHPWFQQSVNTLGGYRDWYVWSETNPGFIGPWGQTVWHPRNGDYYYGLFWGGMPDLNYSHPPVKEAIFDIAEFWLAKGVDGFRLDAIKYLDEDGTIMENTPETFELLEDFRTLYKNTDSEAVTVGEVWSNTESILPYVTEDRLDLCFDFDLAYGIIGGINGSTALPIRQQLAVIQEGYPKLQYATFLTNHDIDRIYNQLQAEDHKMKQAAFLYLTLPGVPFIYYGEEVGMLGVGAHENIRRPMQWTGNTNTGFTTGTPWNAPGGNYPTNNVEDMQNDEASLLSTYRDLVHLRNEEEALRRGYLLDVEASSTEILSYARIVEEEALVMVANMGFGSFQPTFRLPVSSLPAGEYRITEIQSDTDMGTITINASGGFGAWTIQNAILDAWENWVFRLSLETPASITGNARAPMNVKIFPNPASETATIELSEAYSTSATRLTLLRSNGQVLDEVSFSGRAHRLSLRAYSSGLYFVRLENEAGIHVLKLMINHP
jgi:glycosidase